MVNYSGRCAVTGIDIPELLMAGTVTRLATWSGLAGSFQRFTLAKRICLSTLYEKTFDKGLIGLNQNYEILLSGELKKKRQKDYYERFFATLSGRKSIIPGRSFWSITGRLFLRTKILVVSFLYSNFGLHAK